MSNRAHLAWLKDDRRGAVAVEFALVAPVLIALLLGLANTIMGFTAAIQLNNAVQAGASYCMKNGTASCTTTQIQSIVANGTALAIPSGQVTLSLTYGCASAATVTTQAAATPNCSNGYAPGEYAIVGATYTYVTLIGQIGIPLSATTLIRIQ